MFFTRLKNCIKGFLAGILSFGILLAVWSMNATEFPTLAGERTYYLRSKSSQALMQSTICPLDFALLEGESVVFSCDGLSEVEDMIGSYGGKVLFTEQVDGTTSYYCYSPKMRGGVRLGEYFINLHIAVRGEMCAVGSPIIFGGF